METTNSTATNSGEALFQTYVKALGDRDLNGCVDLFTDDATLTFMSGVFRGRKHIEEWHKERFQAGLTVLKVAAVKAKDDTLTADVVVTSKRLAAWKVSSLGGRAAIKLKDGKIAEMKLSPRISNPFEGRPAGTK